jgi:hypothetical protein
MRIFCVGRVIEDIDDYNRTHQPMHLLTAKHSRENDFADAFGQEIDMVDGPAFGTSLMPENFRGIAAGEYQTAMFKPRSGLLNQPKYLPIRYCPLTIELELVDGMETPVISKALTDDDDPGSRQPIPASNGTL